MKLPYGDAVNPAQVRRKLSTYSLNIDHDRGKHKARLFRSKLGITLDNKEVLISALVDCVKNQAATFTKSDEYGDHYIIDFELTTHSGRSTVRSAWMIAHGEDYAALTSTYPIKTRGEAP